MHLLIRKTQRDDGWIGPALVFLLDVRLDHDAEETDLFARYRLCDLVVYDSDAVTQHAYAAEEHAERLQLPIGWRASNTPVEDFVGMLSTLGSAVWNTGAAATHLVTSYLSLRITLGSLLDGQHVESQDLAELLTVEADITQAVRALAAYLDIAVTFDGREDLDAY